MLHSKSEYFDTIKDNYSKMIEGVLQHDKKGIISHDKKRVWDHWYMRIIFVCEIHPSGYNSRNGHTIPKNQTRSPYLARKLI